MPSSQSLTLAQYKFILWLRLNAWPNPLKLDRMETT